LVKERGGIEIWRERKEERGRNRYGEDGGWEMLEYLEGLVRMRGRG
jgi:hypothetical protein